MKKKSFLVVLIAIFIISLTFTVNAAEGDSFKITLTADKTQLKASDTVTLTLKLSDIDIHTGDEGIGAYQGKIEYDENIFEDVKMIAVDGWDTPTLSEEGVFASVKSDGVCVDEDQAIAKIEMKVKVASGVGTVKITNFQASNALEDIETTEATITLNVDAGSVGEDDPNTDDDGTGANDNIVSNENVIQKPAVNGNNVQSPSILPSAGSTTAIALVITTLIISGVVFYIKYKRAY